MSLSLAPATSPVPRIRPDLPLTDASWLSFLSDSSTELARAASAQALVLFFWILVLTSLGIWTRRRAAAGDLRLFGRWKRYEVKPQDGEGKPCRWQVGSARMASGQQKWHCEVCGRDGFSATKGPPEGCNWTG